VFFTELNVWLSVGCVIPPKTTLLNCRDVSRTCRSAWFDFLSVVAYWLNVLKTRTDVERTRNAIRTRNIEPMIELIPDLRDSVVCHRVSP